jgi:hypothetical protein
LFQIFSGIAIAVAGIGFAVHAVVLFWRGIIFE